ncbi:MAG: hypothetical protein MO852_09980, partial [Candidatus Devosia euplotis]|nr:hypothetical protein [Candidatus Devosia euplotis]
MAQDDRKVQPSAPATAQLVPVRIPGESVQEPAAGGPTDFLRSLAAVDARKPEASRQADAPDTAKSSSEHLPSEMLRVQESRPQEPSAQEQRPEQVNLDFDLRSGVRTTSGQERAQTPSQSVEEPAFEPVAADNAAGYDSIADLISAELAGDPAPSPHPVPGASAAPPQDLRAAADDGSTLMAATIAANGAAPHGEILGSSRADHDRFRIPPVFGLGSTGANAAAPAASAAVVQPESRPTPIAPVSDESVAMRQPATPAAVAL